MQSFSDFFSNQGLCSIPLQHTTTFEQKVMTVITTGIYGQM